jgi:hypothetical protein
MRWELAQLLRPRDDLFDRFGLRFLKDAPILKEIINAGTHMLFAHSLHRLVLTIVPIPSR